MGQLTGRAQNSVYGFRVGSRQHLAGLIPSSDGVGPFKSNIKRVASCFSHINSTGGLGLLESFDETSESSNLLLSANWSSQKTPSLPECRFGL